MKLTALAVVILAIGIVLGLALRGTATEAAPPWVTPQFVDDSIEAFNQTVVQPIAATVGQLQGDVSDLDQRVSALEFPGSQQREDQITIFAHGSISSAPTVASETYTRLEGQRDSPPAFLALRPGRYSPAVSFRLDALFDAKPGISTCLRLFDVTANSPITDSEVCHGVASPPTILLRERSGTFSLSAGEHEYSVQGKCIPGANSCSGAGVLAVRIIAEWVVPPFGP